VFTIPQVLFLVLYFGKLLTGASFNGHFIGNSEVMQSLGGMALKQDFFGSLKGMHTQPPLLNFLFGIAILASESHFEIIVQIIWLLVAQLGLFFLTLGLKFFIKSHRITVALSCVYVFTPGTVMYALWSYNTILVQSFSIVLLVAFSLLLQKKWQIFSFSCVAFSSMLLFLIRVPFNFLFSIFLIIFSWFMLGKVYRLRKHILMTLVLTLSSIAGVQLHYFVNFNLLSTSSWTYDQSLNVLKRGLETFEIAEIARQSGCFSEIITKGPWQPIPAYPSCKDGAERVASKEYFNESTRANHLNSKEALLGSLAIQKVLFFAMPRYPHAYFKVLFGTKDFEGTVFNYFGLRNFSFTPLKFFAYNLIPILFAFSLLIFTIYSVFTFSSGISKIRQIGALAFPLIITFYMNLYALLGESVENERIRADSHPVTYFCAILLLARVFESLGTKVTKRSNSL